MFWNLLLLIPTPLAVRGAYRLWLCAKGVRVARVFGQDRPAYLYNGGTEMNFALGLAAIWLLAGLIGTAIQYSDTSTLRHTVELVEAKRAQRDDLLAQVRDELSADAYSALMAATPDSDILVILGNQATDVMVERARLIVALNQEVYELENDQTRLRIDICVYAENPFTPRLFTLPGCPDAPEVQP